MEVGAAPNGSVEGVGGHGELEKALCAALVELENTELEEEEEAAAAEGKADVAICGCC